MKPLSLLLGALLLLAMQAAIAVDIQAQDIWIHSSDKTIDKKFPIDKVDSITIDPCDTAVYDLDGCDVDIDSVAVVVSCGTVYLNAFIVGTPSVITWTIYDLDGNVILASSGSPNLTFSLPTYGSYYGTIEVSCGGGDENGGDEDEDAFEIDYNLPTALFELDAVSSLVGSNVVIDLLPVNQSTGSNPTYSWTVNDSATGSTVATSTQETPVFASLDASKTYIVILAMTDDKGCTSLHQTLRTADDTCNAKFTWKYSWCERRPGTNNVSVDFLNRSTYPASGGATVEHSWDFGDGSPISNTAEPSHTYACASISQVFQVEYTLTVITTVDGVSDTCKKKEKHNVTIELYTPDFTITQCCDGRVVFCTQSDLGEWETPGAMDMCNASTCRKLRPLMPGRSCGLQSSLGHCGQTYWRYYENPGVYTVTFHGQTKYNNFCDKVKEFRLDEVTCFNRNVKEIQHQTFDGYGFKLKFKVVQFPFMHKIIAKIKAKGHKKMNEIRAEFSGNIYSLGSDGCFCDLNPVAENPGTKYNKRKAKVKLNHLGRFRVAENDLTATFYVKTPNGATNTWTIQLGKQPCDRPCILWF